LIQILSFCCGSTFLRSSPRVCCSVCLFLDLPPFVERESQILILPVLFSPFRPVRGANPQQISWATPPSHYPAPPSPLLFSPVLCGLPFSPTPTESMISPLSSTFSSSTHIASLLAPPGSLSDFSPLTFFPECSLHEGTIHSNFVISVRPVPPLLFAQIPLFRST